MLSSESSEQQLKSLDNSKEDPNTLLDRAALIAGVKYDEVLEGYAHPDPQSNTVTNAFREQWMLKWLVKKLKQATQISQDQAQQDNRERFLHNVKTWSLLCYLIATIPAYITLELLVERNFTKLLTSVISSHCDIVQSNLQVQSVATAQIEESDRPRKRLRLSPSPESEPAHLQQKDPAEFRDQSKLITVIHQWAKLLESSQRLGSNSTRSVTPAWAESVKEAAAFVGQTLTFLSILAQHQRKVIINELFASAIVEWLRLWHIFSCSNSSADKKVVYKTFNDLCLVPYLKLYTMLKEETSRHLTGPTKEIERQIALYTILPTRSAFNVRYAATWKKYRPTISWQDIEPVYKMIHEQLGNSLFTEIVTENPIFILKDARWASFLLSIAARIFPRDDVPGRLKEAAWLEALSLCLAHLAFPKNMPRLFNSSKGVLQPGLDDLPPSMESLEAWPDSLLAVISNEEIKISHSSALYLVSSILSWRKRPLPILLLSQLLRLYPESIVQSNDESSSSSAFGLDNLLISIAEHRSLSQPDYEIIIEDVIGPLIEAFMKARDWKRLVNILFSALEEAFRIRVTASFTPANIPSALVWDDEDVMNKFTRFCSMYAPKTFGADLVLEVRDELKHMSSRVGPTTDIFAKLAVLESILKVRGEELLVADGIYEALEGIADSIALNIEQKSDFQGQRWRLWSILITLYNARYSLDRFSSIGLTLEITCNYFYSRQLSDIGKLQQSQRTALLMEQYMIFSLLVSYYIAQRDGSELRQKCLSLLNQALEHLATTVADTATIQYEISEAMSVSSPNVLWDGHVNSMRDAGQLVDAQVARLLKEPIITKNDGQMNKTIEHLTETIIQAAHLPKPSTGGEFHEIAIAYLSSKYPSHININNPDDGQNVNHMQPEQISHTSTLQSISCQSLNQMAVAIHDRISTADSSSKLAGVKEISQQETHSLKSALSVGVIVLNTDETDLSTSPDSVKEITSWAMLRDTNTALQYYQVINHLESCTLILKTLPGIVNQALIDRVLRDLFKVSSSAIEIQISGPQKITQNSDYHPRMVFDRLIGVMDILLTRYRRRLTGRTHLLLPVLQNFLKCFFYTPFRAYLYQNAATSKKKQEFRSSLPPWLDQTLPTSSAEKLSKIISSICNPTAASARSANKSRRRQGDKSLQLNDETRKAKRIAAQYMQYLVMEYARSSLDGVIQPEVREKLMPGLYSILDAMDKDLMRAMNAAMDPSSRAIFKGLYDDWVKDWKWDNN